MFYESLDDIDFVDEEATAQLLTVPADDLPLQDESIDLIVTSPPYWNKRDYGFEGQIGQEKNPDDYVESLLECLREWRRVLVTSGSLFLNIGDSYYRKSLLNIPGHVEHKAIEDGWIIRNRIIWAKPSGMPEPTKDRLANRYEYILHLTTRRSGYYYDRRGYCEHLGVDAAPGDVWTFPHDRSMSSHLAPFPRELVCRTILLACPIAVCTICGKPLRRIERRTTKLNPERPQARRAMELFDKSGLGPEHLEAIQSFGISDVGKAIHFQTGTGHSSERVVKLAEEAKAALGGYFREFTFASRQTVGWEGCDHNSWRRGRVLDPFVGTGTTIGVALDMNRDCIGSDLKPIIDDVLRERISTF